MLTRVRTYLSFVRFSHSVFALPFALTGALLASRYHTVTRVQAAWIIACMVTARSAAMGFNRVVDARFDAENPRTANREIPAGRVSVTEATIFVIVMSVAFIAAASRLNRVCLLLSPVALACIFWYSLAKRYTWTTQFFLGLAMAIAPVGGWLAAGGGRGWEPWLLGVAIALWVGGFDVLYACQDLDVDRRQHLKSIPVRFGIRRSLWISRAMHVGTVACLAWLAAVSGLGALYLAGVAAVAALLAYEQSLVSARDLSQVKRAFDLNGYVGILYFIVTAAAVYLDRPCALSPESRALSPSPPAKDPSRISGMFDAIAGRYDLLNRVLSAGLDKRWRARAVDSLNLTGRETVLDLCTGTADLALAAATGTRQAKRIIGIDFAGAMLVLGKEKVRRAGPAIDLVRGDATQLPLVDASVDAVTIGFGIRNVEQPAVACREIARVLRRHGKLVILEFSLPRTAVVRGFYLWYFRHVLPFIGRAISRHPSAYTYLPESVEAFPSPEAFAQLLRDCGFSAVQTVPLTAGVVYLFVATKGNADAV